MGKFYTMFIDETGSAADAEPFTVTGVIFENKYAYNDEETGAICPLVQRLNDFKTTCFGRGDFIFHLKDIIGVKQPFRLQDGVRVRDLVKFWGDLPGFLSSLDFTIVSVTVDKTKLGHYYLPPKDAYAVAFGHIMESFYSFISSDPSIESARIVLESRGDLEDFNVQKAFFDIYTSGTVHLDVAHARNKIKGFIFANKEKYQAGLEIADLVCNPISRARRGKVEVNPKKVRYGNRNKIFTAIKDKIYVGDKSHDFRDWGFKKVPMVKKLRPWIDDPNRQSQQNQHP